MRKGSTAIFMVPTPNTVNPLKPEGYWLHDADMIGYVVAQGTLTDGRPRLEFWTGAGTNAYEGWEVGARQLAHHDQSGITKFTWTIKAVVRWNGEGNAPEVLSGEVPNRKIKHGVFK